MNIIEMLDHPDLLAGELAGESWLAWRSFLRALFGLRMQVRDMELYRECTGRTTRRREPYREAALIVGRRGGKSRVLALIATYFASCVDWTPHLAPGEDATIAILAADRRQARVILSYVKGFLRSVDTLEQLIDDELTETVRLANRVTIEIHTASIASPRGRTYALVACDECAFWKRDDSTNPDKEVIAGIRPGLATLPNSMLLLASSPYARNGELYSTYKRNYGKEDARVLVWRADSSTMNPSLDPVIIEAAYEDDPISAAAEYGAQFRSDVEAFISLEVVDACTATGLFERLSVEGIAYSAFVDPSGGSSDAFTLAIAHRSGDKGILDVIRERRPPFSPEAVTREYAELLRRYGIREVTGDHYAGEWPRERFKEHGVTYVPCEKSKSAIYGELLPLLNSRKVELLDHQRLTTQLCGLERRTSRSGKDSIDHSPGAHDDVANAVAGVLVKVASKADWRQIWEKLAS